MSKPEFTFKLRGRTWRVMFEDINSKNLDADELGVTDPMTGTISIRPGMPSDIQKSTLWHEITHTILEVGGDATFHEELVCNLVGDAMLELLPQIGKWPTWAR